MFWCYNNNCKLSDSPVMIIPTLIELLQQSICIQNSTIECRLRSSTPLWHFQLNKSKNRCTIQYQFHPCGRKTKCAKPPLFRDHWFHPFMCRLIVNGPWGRSNILLQLTSALSAGYYPINSDLAPLGVTS